MYFSFVEEDLYFQGVNPYTVFIYIRSNGVRGRARSKSSFLNGCSFTHDNFMEFPRDMFSHGLVTCSPRFRNSRKSKFRSTELMVMIRGSGRVAGKRLDLVFSLLKLSSWRDGVISGWRGMITVNLMELRVLGMVSPS